jgi:hypothetical protein
VLHTDVADRMCAVLCCAVLHTHKHTYTHTQTHTHTHTRRGAEWGMWSGAGECSRGGNTGKDGKSRRLVAPH